MSFQTLVYRLAGYVRETAYTAAHSLLVAQTAETPVNLEVAEQTVLGRIAGGDIAALTVAQLQKLLGIDPNLLWEDSTADLSNETAMVSAFDIDNPDGYAIVGSCFWTFHAYKSSSPTKSISGTISANFDGNNISVMYDDVTASEPTFSLTVTDNDPVMTYTISLEATVSTNNWHIFLKRAPANYYLYGLS